MQQLRKKHTYSDRAETDFRKATVYLWRDPDDGTETEYYFDEIEAQRWVSFVEDFCSHTQAEWKGKRLKLDPWQKQWIRELFGWRRCRDGCRRYQTAYVSMPRKNGKTLIVAAIMLGLTIIDYENGAENFIAASSEKQAAKLFKVAKDMIELNEDLKEICTVNRDCIEHKASGNTFKVVPCNPDMIHGTNPHGACIDEYHVVTTEDLADAFETGMSSRSQSLMLYITTAGKDPDSPCGREYKVAKEVLEARQRGEEIDPTYFVLIFEAPEDADVSDPKVWAAANPNWGTAVKPEKVRRLYRRAQHSPALMRTFRRFVLNQWVEGDEKRYCEPAVWAACKTARPIDEEQFRHKVCYGGLDLGFINDLAAFAGAFPREAGRRTAIFRAWNNKRAMRVRAIEKKPYPGNIIVAGDKITDDETIIRDICNLRDVSGFDIKNIRYDPNKAWRVVSRLMAEGFEMIEVLPRVQYLSEPTKELLALIIDGRISHHDALADFCLKNAVAISNANEDIRLDKSKSADKIDLLAALVLAISGAMLHEDEADDPYADGLIIL